MKKLRVGILGATGFVGQRFIQLLENHPWFEITALGASSRSSGKKYGGLMENRWYLQTSMPKKVRSIGIKDVADIEGLKSEVDFVFSALGMDKEEIKKLEIEYAAKNIPVISNNSAHRWTSDIPMIIPEVNANHVRLIDIQRKNRGWKRGCIAVKPNCSIQSYVAILSALQEFNPTAVSLTSMQAISGAGKTFTMWPEMIDNVIPYIDGEEEKSEKEPMKIWAKFDGNALKLAQFPTISATCIRVPVNDGHMASIAVRFKKKPTKKQILEYTKNYKTEIADLNLPSAPKQFITYFHEDNKPQTHSERDFEKGMGITFGRLREDTLFDWKFVALSHNTIRGAAGGAILTAELLKVKNYL